VDSLPLLLGLACLADSKAVIAVEVDPFFQHLVPNETLAAARLGDQRGLLPGRVDPELERDVDEHVAFIAPVA